MTKQHSFPIQQILEDYIDIVLPAMYKQNYHLRLAKGGIDYPYLAEQSHLGHSLNGVFGLIEILKFIEQQQLFIYGLDGSIIRKAIALITIHDLHKFTDYEKLGNSEFAIPLERLQEEYKRLNLIEFAGELDPYIMRYANVSKRSKHRGDLLLSDEDNGSLLWLLVRVGDTIASVTTAAQAIASLKNYLSDLIPGFGVKYELYSHQLGEIRGVLTNLIHSSITKYLNRELGFQDIVYFSSGTLFIGFKDINVFSREDFIKKVAIDILDGLEPRKEMIKSMAKDGLRSRYSDFENYVHKFAEIEEILEIILETTNKPEPNKIEYDIKETAKKAPQDWLSNFNEKYKIKLKQEKLSSKYTIYTIDESKNFKELWSLVRHYLLYVDNLLKQLVPGFKKVDKRLDWYCLLFNIPPEVKSSLKDDQLIWSSGNFGKHIVIAGYFFLKGVDFQDRSAESNHFADVLQKLHNHILAAFNKLDTKPGQEKAIEKLGFRPELINYINAQLNLSFAPHLNLADDSLVAYVTSKKKSHSQKLCSICNLSSSHIQSLSTGVLDDFGGGFSNRTLPVRDTGGKNRNWCPICHLEFILRKLTGLSLPKGADYKKSRRIHIYALPTFSFTPEYARVIDRILIKPLQEISSLPIRDYGAELPGLPRLWLEKRELDPEWIERVIDVFNREAERIAQKPNYVGDRLLAAKTTFNQKDEEQTKLQANYYLVPWEHSVYESDKDDTNIPTRTEAWAKATFAAVVISSLTSSRVYVTEQPYLPVSNPSELKATVTLDSPPPIITKLLGNDQYPKLCDRSDTISLYGVEKGYKSGLERALDLGAAMWMITSSIHRPNSQTKDKQIAERLGDIVVNPLAGAHFYKEYGRLNNDKSPFDVLTKACAILLENFGGDLMDLVTKITEKALEIRLPYREYGRGKAHNYELVLRESVDAMRSAFKLIPELRQTALTGQKPSAEAITELKQQASGTLLKAMERRQTTKRGDGIINPYRQDLGKLVGEFIDLMTDEVFFNRSDQSFAQFLKLENSLADGIYYYTDRNINQKWQEYNEFKAKNQAEPQSEDAA